MKRVSIISAVGLALALAGLAVAGSLPTFTVEKRTQRTVSAAVSSNAPTACTTNLLSTYYARGELRVANTNGIAVVLFRGTGTTNDIPVAIIGPNSEYKQLHPFVDNGSYSVRSTNQAVNVEVYEAWGY
jgi:hypothetical protein